jgi:hypothetical protein
MPYRLANIAATLSQGLVGAFVRLGETFDQLIWARAPRAGAVDDSPVLLTPPDLAIKLAVAEVHRTELG